MKSDPVCYVGGSVDYFDFCNVDEISLLDLSAMMKEVGHLGGYHSYSYRLPGTTMERGCFHLETDDELLDMGALVKGRYVDIFVTVLLPLSSSQPELNTQNIDYAEETLRQPPPTEDPYMFSQPEPNYRDFDFMDSTQAEIREEEEMRNFYGFEEGEDCDEGGISDGSQYEGDDIDREDDDSDAETFYSDNSNKDDSDDDLLFDANVENLEATEDRFDDDALFEDGKCLCK